MWELCFFLENDLTEALKFAKPKLCREKIEASYQSGLLEVDKEGITLFYPVKEIKKIQMKRI